VTTPLASALESFDEFLYFPSIAWDHSWERQQTLIDAFCRGHAPRRGVVVAPTGLIDHAPWNAATWRRALARRAPPAAASGSAQHVSNPRPANLDYVQPRFPRGTNAAFASMARMSSPELRALRKARGRRLVFASYVNPLVERFLENADFTILDLAERRQANPALAASVLERERRWAARADLLVADNAATLADYADVRARAGRAAGLLLPQGFTPPASAPAPAEGGGRTAAYLGNLHHAIDYDYLLGLIDGNPDWTFRMCGQRMSHDATRVLERPNVDYRGVIANRQIAGFLEGVSWGLIPYTRTEWTAGVFPTKLFEYLGHGVPVLSTSIPEVARFQDDRFVHLSDTPVTLSAWPVDRAALAAFVAPHTWAGRLDAYGRAISSAAAA